MRIGFGQLLILLFLLFLFFGKFPNLLKDAIEGFQNFRKIYTSPSDVKKNIETSTKIDIEKKKKD